MVKILMAGLLAIGLSVPVLAQANTDLGETVAEEKSEADRVQEDKETTESDADNDADILAEIDGILEEAEVKAEKDQNNLDELTSTNRLVPLSRRTGFIVDRASVPETFVALDLLSEHDISGVSNETTNNIDVREIEFGYSGYVDWFASVSVLFALHRSNHGDDAGEYIFDIHEAAVELYALPGNLRAKIGKMFFDAGRLNGIHRHDWHFTNSPVIHQEVFNDTFVGEGAADTGIELSYLMPWDFFQELKVGVFRGRTFGHTHGDGPQKPAPLWTARLKQFVPIIGNWGTEFGFTYLRYHETTNSAENNQTFGTDVTIRWFMSRFYMLIWSTEVWHKIETKEQTESDTKSGFYTYFDFIFMQNYSVGYRFDYYTDMLNSLNLDRQYNGHSVWFTWRPSEFSRYRVNYELKNYAGYENLNGSNHAIYFQGTFMLGFHPPHKY